MKSKSSILQLLDLEYMTTLFTLDPWIKILAITLLIGLLGSCKDDEGSERVNPMVNPIELTVTTDLNPSSYAPLSAKLLIEADTTVQLELIVKGQHGSASDFKINTSDMANSHEVDVHGLYAGYENQVEIIAKGEDDTILGIDSITILTPALIADMPAIEVLHESLDADYPVFHLVNYFGYDVNFVPQRPFLVDQFGDIRWYLDFSSHELIDEIYLDNGLFHMQNNDIVFSGTGLDQVFIADLFGNIKQNIPLGDYTFHHTVIEKPDGHLLLTATKKGRPTVEDIILEVDPISETLVKVWDLTESLDQDRLTFAFNPNDWIHVNGITFDERDNTIIISGRYQGLIKLNANNEVQWILAPHKEWAPSASGTDLNSFLLQPLDQNDKLITDSNLIDGSISTTDFDWNWYQHSPIILPNGNIMCFDNGLNRHYGASPLYSRAVEYEIDQTNMTVKQIWEYGKELGIEGYSRSVSKVNFVPETNHVSLTPGAIAESGAPHGRIMELDKLSKELKLDIKITPPNSYFGITFHNAQRFEFK